MKFGSVCSGIEAASVAWNQIGWEAAWFSEIEPFPSALLNHYYPETPNLGDMTTLPERIQSGDVEAPDLFCGGTPCQAFSVAGQRKSLADARGNLSLTFCEIADVIDSVRSVRGLPPAIVFWENVPGVLSTADNAFGCFLAQLCGGDEPLIAPDGWPDAGVVTGPKRTIAWRVLDAQYFGLAQRRRRVFVVASARNDFDPAAVLLEFDGVRRDTAPSRETGQGAAKCLTAGVGGNSAQEMSEVAGTLTANAGGLNRPAGNANELDFCIPVMQAVGTDCYNGAITGDIAATMGTPGSSINASGPTVMQAMQVRRLTPVECERLQGFPDGYTAIPWRGKSAEECPDGPRYKALGNSWAVPVVTWIGKRIQKNLA